MYSAHFDRRVICLRIRKISCDKISVYIADDDFEKFDLDFDKKMPQAADLHKFLFEVMEVVKTETGFDPYNGGQVVVEAEVSEGGLTLNITKIRTRKNKISREEFRRARAVKVKSGAEAVSASDLSGLIKQLKSASDTDEKSGNIAFVFASFEDLESAMCGIDENVPEESELYRDDERYALIIPFDIMKNNYGILYEYAHNSVRSDVALQSIREGWKCVLRGSELEVMHRKLQTMQ